MTMANDEISGDGNTPSAITDLRDIGRYVAKIVADPRTLNKMVFAYNTVKTPNEIYSLLEELSGEKLERKYVGSHSNRFLEIQSLTDFSVDTRRNRPGPCRRSPASKPNISI
jgi:hypothetical protein